VGLLKLVGGGLTSSLDSLGLKGDAVVVGGFEKGDVVPPPLTGLLLFEIGGSLVVVGGLPKVVGGLLMFDGLGPPGKFFLGTENLFPALGYFSTGGPPFPPAFGVSESKI